MSHLSTSWYGLTWPLARCLTRYMHNDQVPHHAQVTFRLPSDLDRQMRATSDYFRRSLTEEWRAAGAVYQRVVQLWAAAHSARPGEAPTDARDSKTELIAEVCSGLILEPKSLEDLKFALATLQPSET